MTEAVRKRYEEGLDRLRSIVTRTGEARDSIQSLLRLAASNMYDALEINPEADLEDIINELRNSIEFIALENMRQAAREADDEEGESISDMALAFTFTRLDISAPAQKYATALSQEVKWFVAAGFAYGALRDYLRDPLGFLALESSKPSQKNPTKQTMGRMTLAPVFMDGNRRRSLSEVLGDFRGSITAVGSGNSYDVSRSIWMFLNVTSMEAHTDALIMKWTNQGSVGFYVYRASNYDCPLCDEQCGWLHPLTGETPPYHPHCVCCMVEVRANESLEDFEK